MLTGITNRTESQVPILINLLMHALLASPHSYLISPLPHLCLELPSKGIIVRKALRQSLF